MKYLLKIEEVSMFILSIYFFNLLKYQWWVFPALLFLPDIGMVGYLFNNKTGAITYNLFHHKGIAIAIGLSGMALKMDMLMLTGIILFGHSSMDRILGYGLKFKESFAHTHLGIINTKKEIN